MKEDSVLFNITVDDVEGEKTTNIEFPNGAIIEGKCNGISFEGVYLSKKEHKRLKHRERILSALEAGGVDNWSYYSDALNEYYPEMFEEEN